MKPHYKTDRNRQFESDLATLISMGFESDRARQALESTDRGIDGAVAFLLSSGGADIKKPSTTSHQDKAPDPEGLVANEGADLKKPSGTIAGSSQEQVGQFKKTTMQSTSSIVSSRWKQDPGDDHPAAQVPTDQTSPATSTFPGAVHMAGTGQPDHDEEAYTTTAPEESSVPIAMEAELVQEEPNRAYLVGRIQQLEHRLDEQLRAERNQQVVTGEPIADATGRSECSCQNKKCMRWAIGLAIVAVVVGVAVTLAMVLPGRNSNDGDASDVSGAAPSATPTSRPSTPSTNPPATPATELPTTTGIYETEEPTAAPTTEAPTAAPSTEAPTWGGLETEEPTAAPSTEAPTAAPSTEAPTWGGLETEEPTAAPSTETPTFAPTTEAPTLVPTDLGFVRLRRQLAWLH